MALTTAAERATDTRVTYDRVTRTVARTLGNPGRGYYILLGSAVTLLAIGIVCLMYLLRYGMGLAGYSMPTYWAIYITCFVFWVGIAHSGTLISAILFLFRAGWRTAVYRCAEIMTVFAVMTAGLFPLIHIGRQWYFYWLIPYPNERGLWPNFKSPLVWDEFAIGTYFTVSTCFLIMGLIPDIAAVRDVATGWRRKLYQLTSLGWRGTNEQWRHYRPAYLYLAALATPLVLSVHSVVSWDFAMAQVPAWHETLFAPYFVAGAIYSGCAMVISLLVPLRKFFQLEEIVTVRHFENLAKLCLATGMIVCYAYCVENFVAWYGGPTPEREAFLYRAFGKFWWAGWTMNICNAFLPWLLWFKKIRTNITALFVIAFFVNLGMWMERFVIIAVHLAGEPFNKFVSAGYNATWADWGIMAGSFGWFFMWFLLFVKNFPSVSVAEVKEELPPPRRPVPLAPFGPIAATVGTTSTTAVLAVFEHLDSTVGAIVELKRSGHLDFTVYSPLPRHELEQALAQPVSPVRAYTLIGGIAGCAIGAWIALYMSYDWPLQVGGKTIGSIPPYVVIMFEMTVLFGALTTLIGVVLNTLLGTRHHGTIPYDVRYTNDKFGICVPAGPHAGRAEALLKGCGAEEVRRE